MSKQIVLRATWIGACALMIGLAGCHNQQPAVAAPPPGTAEAIPQTMLEQVKGLPPDQRDRAMKQMQNAQVGAKPNADGTQTGSTSGGQ
jgi:hypothetical protein